jgi:sugar phosphate isomerase/epimerase
MAIMESSTDLTRRGFIRKTAGWMLSGGTLAIAKDSAVSSPSKPLVVACRDTLLKAAKSAGGGDSWPAMKELGVTGVEVEVNPELGCPNLESADGGQKKYSLATPSGIATLKDDLSKNGLVITAFLMHNQLDERLAEELEWTKKLVAAAVSLDVPIIRIDVVPRRMKREEFLPFAIKACTKLCEIVEGTRMNYGIENHGSITNDPEFLQQLFDGVGSLHLGLTLDTANFYWYGHPLKELYEIFERFAPRVFHTHCKSIRYPDDKKNVRRPMGFKYDQYACPIYEGDIDFGKVVAILRKANYCGDLCLENESLGKYPEEQHAQILKKEIALLRRLAVAGTVTPKETT